MTTLIRELSSSAGLGGVKVQFDEDGFLIDADSWSEATSEFIAEMDGIGPLDERHWRVIRFVRDRYLRLGAIPPMRSICRSAALDKQAVKSLFGGCLQVWRIAGLPNPGEEARAYMA